MNLQITYPASKRSEVFDQINDTTNWYTIEHNGWHLPATEESHDWCGNWSTMGCLNVKAHENTEAHGKGFVKTFQRSCYRADCVICHTKWMARESNKATRRIEKYEKLSGKNAKHIIISVPSWLYYKSKKELAKESYKILKDIGCIGGTTIFHPFSTLTVWTQRKIGFVRSLIDNVLCGHAYCTGNVCISRLGEVHFFKVIITFYHSTDVELCEFFVWLPYVALF